jgi:DNA adenine methylase
VTLGLSPEKALLNDINPHLVNFYSWLKRGLRVDIQLEKNVRLFYAHRTRFNALVAAGQETSPEAAALFYYLNRTGYNGLCRFNSRGEFNVPFGKYKRIGYVDDFSAYKSVFASWEFSRGDFETLPVTPDDFIYADPPYDVPFTKYSREGFDWDDQVRTAEWLAVHPGPVVLVNQATARIVTLYQSLGFLLTFVSAPRRINSSGDRTPAREVLATRQL